MTQSRSVLIAALALSLALSGCSHLPSWLGGSTAEKPKLPGERNAVLAVGTELKPDEAASKLTLVLPTPNANADWQQHSGIFTSGTANLAATGNFDKEDSSHAGDGAAFEHTLIPRPVVGGGQVFAMDGDGRISAHEAGNISKVTWTSDGVYEDVDQNNIGGGLAYDSGKIYATSGRGKVVALDAATGKELWHMSVHIPFRSAPRVGEGKLFAVTIDDQLYALDSANGNVLWTHRGISETAGVMSSLSPALVTGAVIVPYTSGEIYMLATGDGHELWNGSVSGGKTTAASSVFSGIGGDPVVDGQVVFVASSGGGFSVLGVDQGAMVWSKPVASFNTPWIAGDFAFMLATDNTVVCFMKYDGRVRWATRLEGFEDMKRKLYPITWRGPVLVGGKLALVSNKGKLALINAMDGKIEEIKDIPSDIFTAPVVAGGVMYLINKDAKLYSLQ